jgi:hypothetical protein
MLAFADHVQITHLEDLQAQQAFGKQHRVQREQGQGMQTLRIGHGARLSSHEWGELLTVF